MHPFVLVTANGQPWPVDTDRASEIADRLWEKHAGRELSKRFHHAIAVRAYVRPDQSELAVLLAAISEWVDEVGEEAVGEQVLNLQAAVHAELTAFD